METTLGIIKPDATAANHIGQILSMAEEKGLVVAGLKMVQLTRKQAEGFYHVHRERPFFSSLVEFMTEGPVVVFALRGEGAIQKWRQIMGATDPSKAEEGTVRKRFGASIERNASHGSDSPESARFEVRYFFNDLELLR